MNKQPHEQLTKILFATDQCVLCGICSSLCPTYQQNPVEAESPRGRIAIIQAYAQHSFKPSPAALEHIQHCLGCNQCQNTCPSEVAFESIIDNFKDNLKQNRARPLKWLLRSSAKTHGLNRFKTLAKIYQYSGLALMSNLLLKQKSIQKLHQLLNFISKTALQLHNTQKNQQETVGLFIGCSGELFDSHTLNNCSHLLNKLGVPTFMTRQQYCCGALHQHNGELKAAAQLKAQNDHFFNTRNIKKVIFSANGCGRQLQKNKHLDVQYIDIISFIYPLLINEKLKPLKASVLIHNSCSNSALGDINTKTLQLLNLIPNLNLIELEPNSCCGAGGSNLLQYPELANSILDGKIQKIKKLAPDYLVSDNLGCSLHYKTQLAQHNLDIEIIHPISLLAMQLT